MHSHDLGLFLLLENGVVGLAGWLVVLLSVVRFVPAPVRWRLLPMIVGLLVLNTWDATFFERGGFCARAASTAVVAASRAPAANEETTS